MKEVIGGIRTGSAVARLGLEIGIRVWGVVPVVDDTCLRETISRRLHPHACHCPRPLAANIRLPDGMGCQT